LPEHVEVATGAYHDSVALMQVSRTVAGTPGVTAAQVAMGTDLNLEVLAGMGFSLPDGTGANDVVIALRAETAEALAAGRAAVAEALSGPGRRTSGSADLGAETVPRTLGGAVARGANLALVTVPGHHAVVEAYDAVEAGIPVMVFSDNVPLAEEVALKEAADRHGTLVMGPDCGTAVVAGVALGFANVVRPGPVGLVAASGTGAQQVMCLLDAAGVGMSHCLGVGGRDLSAEVAGRSARRALAALEEDPATSSILVVSKPPAPGVLAYLRSYAASLHTPVHWATLSRDTPDLTAATIAALAADGHPAPDWPAWVAPASSRPGHLRGLFCGGTLADEAMLVAAEALGPIRSNIPLSPELALGPDLRHDGHLVVDFGDDELTRGRPHPMIDPSLRLERVAVELADPSCGVLLLDLLLGHGAHPDQARDLAAAIAGAEAPVVVSLCGTAGDPQGFEESARLLHEAGASVFLSNSAATRHALSLLAGSQVAGPG
jgi:FdrA protein